MSDGKEKVWPSDRERSGNELAAMSIRLQDFEDHMPLPSGLHDATPQDRAELAGIRQVLGDVGGRLAVLAVKFGGAV